jgi:hypothetical protein
MTEKRRRGRPRRIPSEAATVRIWAFVTPSERAAIEELAGGEMTIAQLIRDAVNAYVADFNDSDIFTAAAKSKQERSSKALSTADALSPSVERRPSQ